ncbi:hypothetical protein [Nitrosomonas sp.]|uniref:hypothetical protein n=1 Tax=Nitrosomonas sp. TaxID=42353 RepID=UPI0025E39C90|nr:hypothetical protein [Nitrosomonas sp.]
MKYLLRIDESFIKNEPGVLRMILNTTLDILESTSNRFNHDSHVLRSWQQWQRQNPVSIVSARNQLLAAARFSIAS